MGDLSGRQSQLHVRPRHSMYGIRPLTYAAYDPSNDSNVFLGVFGSAGVHAASMGGVYSCSLDSWVQCRFLHALLKQQQNSKVIATSGKHP